MKHNKFLIAILLFIIHCSLITASAQSWQELMDSTNYYQEKQDFETALKWGKLALEQAKEEFGEMDTNYVSSLNSISKIFENLGELDSAIYYAEICLKNSRTIFKSDNQDLAYYIGEMAYSYNIIGNNEKAEPLFNESLEMYRRIFKDDNPELATIINNLAMFYFNKGEYKKSEPLLKESLEMRRRIFKNDHLDLAGSINNMAVFYDKKGDYQLAESMYQEALEIIRRIFKGDHPDLATCINNMAFFYHIRGNFIAADTLYKESLEMKRRLFKTDHPNLISSLGNLALFYSDNGYYKLAEPLFKESLEMSRRIYKGDHTDLAKSILNMGLFYNNIGDLIYAEPLFKESLKMSRRIYKGDHTDLAKSINAVAYFYFNIGNYIQAKTLFNEALQMRRRIFKVDHPDLVISINNMAMFYNNRGDYQQAENLLKEALDMSKHLYKKDHPKLAACILNLAHNYDDLNNFDLAEYNYKASIDMYRRIYKGDHPDLATNINNIAMFYFNKGEYKKTEPLLKESLEMRKRIYISEHPNIANSYKRLAELYSLLGFSKEADSFYVDAYTIYYKVIINYFPSLSEKEKEQFWSTMKNHFEAFNSFVMKRSKENPDIVQNSYNNQLLTKGMLLGSTQKVKNNILNSGDKELIRKYEEWLFQKGRIAKLYSLSKEQLTKKGINIDSIIYDANDKEKELSRLSEDFAKEYEKKKIEWQDVQKLLKQDEAAVEIVRFRYYDKNRWTDTVYYGALLLTSSKKKPVDLILFKNGNDLEEKYLSNYYTSIIHQLEDKDSYEQYWKPIADKLKGIKKVYLSVDGVYNQINLNTLRNPKTGEYLLAEKDIVLVTSTRDLVERNYNNNLSQNTAELFGDPKFNIDSNKHKELALTYKNTDKPYIERGIVDSLLTRGSLTPLPGTRKEIENIYRILKTKEWGVNSHLGEEALEEAVKTINSPRVLHIATHGMFLKDIDKSNEDDRMFGMETKRFVENPLLRSMLLFAGADNTISKKGENTTETKTDDGLLTAYEAMNLNLENTELLVMSACETGLGEIKNGEGVYGLQRAFVQAGAKSIIMSLWKVSDEASQELMTSFYTKWLSGKPKRQAFREAQIEMMKQHPEPYYWGAFVMVGE